MVRPITFLTDGITVPEDRFWSMVKKGSTCWEWTGRVESNGYARIKASPRTWNVDRPTNVLVHRVSWYLHFGKIPEEMTVDHLCKNRACVNPHHLDLVPLEENARRKTVWQSLKTECPRGHEYDETNTRVYQGKRYCKACDREKKREMRNENVIRHSL